MKLLRIFNQSVKEYFQTLGGVYSAAIAYYILVSIIPLLIVTISAAAIFLGSSEASRVEVFSLIVRTVPNASEEIIDLVSSIIAANKVTSGIGIAGLIWSGSQMFLTLEEGLTRMWDCPTRSFFNRLALILVFTLCVGIFPLISVLLTFAMQILKNFGDDYLFFSSFLFKFLTFILPTALSFLAFTLIYKILPNCKVNWKSAFSGGLLTALLFEAAKQLFHIYLANFADLGRIYGSIGGVIGAVLWIYYGATVTLFGGKFVHLLDTQK